MSFCLTASRLMKASEVKKEWYKRKMASAPTLAIAQ